MGTVLWQTVKTQMKCSIICSLLILKESLRTEIHHNLENSTYDLLKYKMGNPILIVSMCTGASSGSVVECLSRDQGVAGSSLTVGKVLCP